MTLLDELLEKKLGTPKGLRKFIFHQTDYQTYPSKKPRYIDCIELYKGKLLLRTFAYHNVNKSIKYKDIEYQEVCRRLQGEKEVLLCNIENTMYCGRVVFYGNQTWCNDHYHGWVYKASNKNWYFEQYKMYDEQQIIDMLNIPYCQWFKAKENHYLFMNFFDYICAYLEQPKIELLVKANLTQFVHVHKKLNFKAKSLDKIFKIPNTFINYLKKMSYTDLLLIRNKNHKIKNYEDLLIVREIYQRYSNNKDYKYIRRYARPQMLNFIKEFADYSQIREYEDYLRMCCETGIEITNSVICKKEWAKEHDRMVELIKIKKGKETQAKMFEHYKELIKFTYSKNNLVILPCEKVSELENESKVLDHCVKTYAEKYMKKQTNIMFIRKIEDISKPYVTLEFQNKRVIQCRGYKNNRYNQLDKNVIDFVNDWCNQFKLKSCFS